MLKKDYFAGGKKKFYKIKKVTCEKSFKNEVRFKTKIISQI